MSYSHRGTPPSRIQAGQPQEQPPQEAPIPETILVECARNTAPSLNDGLNSNPASWTCNFDGGIQLKKGDAISINSATLNSVGVGSLINFTQDGDSQNNKATWIHSFYVVNDGKNDKRSAINMDTTYNGGQGMFRFDTTNNDCDLYRFTNTGAECIDATREVSYYQDKFFPLRVDKTDPEVDPEMQLIDIASQTMGIVIYTDNFLDSFGDQAGQYTYFSVNSLNADGSLGAIQDVMTKNIFERGRNYAMTPTDVAGLNTPNQYNDPSMKVIFGVIDIINNAGNSILNAPDGVYVRCTPMSPLIMNGDLERQSAQTKTVNFFPIIGEVNFSTNAYAYCPVYYNWEQQLFNLNDDVYLINYELLDPNTIGNKSIQGIQTGGIGVAKGKVTTSNAYKFSFELLGLPSGGGAFPVQGYGTGQFKFRLNDISFPTIADMVDTNNGYKQFGIRIYTKEGYKYGFFYLGTNEDTSTITNQNTINVTSGAGIPVYFNVDGFQQLGNNGAILVEDSYVPTPFESDLNPHEILFIGKLLDPIDVRYFNTSKQTFVGNFTSNKNLRDAGSVTEEAYWAKEPFVNQTTLFYDDTSTFNPVHIDGYTGGLMRNFNYFVDDDVTREAQFAETFQYVKHYETFSYEITSNWNSPSDIATALTDQTHAPQNARTTSGTELNNSAGLGIPHNRLCIPVFTSGGATETDLLTNTNVTEGSFKIIDPTYTDVKVTRAFVGDGLPQTVTANNVDIYFRTGNLSINYPSAITNTPRNLVYNPANPIVKTNDIPPDFNQGSALMGSTAYIRTAKSVDAEGAVITYPIQYIDNQDTFISQFAGANDISFGWDDNLSRFTIGDLHVGIFSLSQVGEDATGGQDEVKVYAPALSYKKNQTRSGGIFIPNWYSLKPTQNMGLQQIINDLNLNFDFEFYNGTFDDETQWFLTSVNSDIVGKRFWNKLGFADSQITQQTGTLINKSTNNEIDTALTIVPSEEPAANRPAFNDTGNFASDNNGGNDPSATATKAGFEFSSFGNLNLNNHSIGMGGIPNTQGSPIQYFSNIQVSLHRTDKTTITNDERDKFIDSEGQYNPDREINTYYTVSTRDDMTTTLDALNLPVKTEFSYFYILSDLVESKFYSSKNGGQPINCIGTINKLNSDNDFYFSYASPQRIYVTKDRVVTSIKTSVKNIDFSDPAIIGDFSSVVYQIDRYNPIPEKIPLSIPMQQNQYFDNLSTLTEEVLKAGKLPHGANNVEQAIEDLFIGNVPTENRQDIVNDILEYGIGEVQELTLLERLNKKLNEDPDDEGRAAPAPDEMPRGTTFDELADEDEFAPPISDQSVFADSLTPTEFADSFNIYLSEQRDMGEVPLGVLDDPTVQSIYNNFLQQREKGGRVTQRELRAFLKTIPNLDEGTYTEALAGWKELVAAQRGMQQQARSGNLDPELLSRYRRGGVDLRRRQFEGRDRPPPAYVTPPRFEEENPDADED